MCWSTDTSSAVVSFIVFYFSSLLPNEMFMSIEALKIKTWNMKKEEGDSEEKEVKDALIACILKTTKLAACTGFKSIMS